MKFWILLILTIVFGGGSIPFGIKAWRAGQVSEGYNFFIFAPVCVFLIIIAVVLGVLTILSLE